ncbi:MAG: hypothetical protein ACUVUE_06485, partial [Candidatus Bathycorpusculaceae bacterium]
PNYGHNQNFTYACFIRITVISPTCPSITAGGYTVTLAPGAVAEVLTACPCASPSTTTRNMHLCPTIDEIAPSVIVIGMVGLGATVISHEGGV